MKLRGGSISNISTRLIIISILIAVIGVVSIGTYSYYAIKNSLLDTAGVDLKGVVEFNSRKITDFFEKTNQDLRELSEDPMVGSFTSSGLVSTRIKYNLKEMDEFNYIIVTDDQGKLYAGNYENDSGKEIKFSDYSFYKELAQGNNFSGIVDLNFIEGNSFIVSRPLTRGEEIRGSIIGIINFSTLYEQLNNIKSTDQYEYVILDDSGLVIYHPNKELLLSNYFGRTSGLDVTNGEGKTITYYIKDEPYLAVSQRLNQGGWRLVVANPYKNILTAAYNLKKSIIIFGLILVVLASLVAYIFGKNIGNRINDVNEKTHRISNGDLTTRVDVTGKDELTLLGKSVNKMVEDLENIVQDINSKSIEVKNSAVNLNQNLGQATDSAEQVSTAIEQVASGADEQAVNFEKIVEVVSKMVNGINLMLENNKVTVKNAKESLNSTQEGSKSMDRLIAQMEIINKKVQNMTNIMKRMDKTSSEIGEIVGIINSIAKQTNLLALNAAIESARAGQYGRGFSVVADEIRELAEESMASADKISQLINETLKNTQEARESMVEEIEAVDKGRKLSEQTGEIFEKIHEMIKITHDDAIKANQISNELAEGAEEVESKIEVTASIAEEISASSQEVTASAEEQVALMTDMNKAAENLSRLSKDMQELIDHFKLKN